MLRVARRIAINADKSCRNFTFYAEVEREA